MKIIKTQKEFDKLKEVKKDEEFNLKDAREALFRILTMDKSNACFGIEEDIAKSILNMVKTSDKEFIRLLKEIIMTSCENKADGLLLIQKIEKLTGGLE